MKNPEFEKWQETLAQELKLRGIDSEYAYKDEWGCLFNSGSTATDIAYLIEEELNCINNPFGRVPIRKS